jgi:hypothetical protein
MSDHAHNKQTKPIDQPHNNHGHILEVVDSARYLGINIHRSVNWNQHINAVTKKANNKRSFLQQKDQTAPLHYPSQTSH